MKKSLLAMTGAVCCLLIISCQKNVREDLPPEEELTEESHKKGKPHQEGPGYFDPNNLIAPFAQLTTLGTGYSFTEGPAVNKSGDVFFTDQPNDKIYKWNAKTGHISLFLTGTGRSNGMAFDKQGNLIACADMYGEVRKIFPNGSHVVLVNNYNGKLLNGPNDVWINPKTGGMYITDPIFPRDYWDDNDPRKQPWEPIHSEQAASGKGGHVYYLAPGSSTLVRVTTMAGWNADSWPNGIVGSPDGKKLYVNQWSYNGSGGIWSFDIRPNGTLSNIKTFVASLDFCDGMSMDDRGNVYVSAGQGVLAFNPKGEKVLDIPTGGATNNVFAGKDEKTLFITGPVTAVSSIRMRVKGVEKF